MKLGAFSISLSVKDLSKSRAFYEQLGFEVFAGEAEKKYFILKNEDSLIGIFEGMFEGNIITFNPGWNQDAAAVEPFDDVRQIQAMLQSNNIELINTVDTTNTAGPASIVLKDPDGNVILIDQHR